jgi:pseudouridine-5'-monophosphatase
MGWDIKQQILGTRGDVWSSLVLDALGVPAAALSPAALVAGWEGALARLYGEVEALPGAEAVTAELAARRIPQAIATSSSAPAVAKKRVPHEPLFARMATIVTGEMAARSKPAPDIFLLAAERLGVKPEEALVVEDSAPGIAAARAAGMYAVAVPDPRMPHAPFVAAGAHEILASLEEFDVAAMLVPGGAGVRRKRGRGTGGTEGAVDDEGGGGRAVRGGSGAGAM